MRGRHTPPAPLWDGEFWNADFLFGNERFECDASPLERGLRGVLWRGARQGLMCCEIQFRGAWRCDERGVICQASGGYFGFRKLCAGVTHPPPLSRGEL